MIIVLFTVPIVIVYIYFIPFTIVDVVGCDILSEEWRIYPHFHLIYAIQVTSRAQSSLVYCCLRMYNYWASHKSFHSPRDVDDVIALIVELPANNTACMLVSHPDHVDHIISPLMHPFSPTSPHYIGYFSGMNGKIWNDTMATWRSPTLRRRRNQEGQAQCRHGACHCSNKRSTRW